MANRRPRMKAHPAGQGKPGIPYRPIFPPKPEGEWYFHYEQREWVAVDPYKVSARSEKGGRGAR